MRNKNERMTIDEKLSSFYRDSSLPEIHLSQEDTDRASIPDYEEKIRSALFMHQDMERRSLLLSSLLRSAAVIILMLLLILLQYPVSAYAREFVYSFTEYGNVATIYVGKTGYDYLDAFSGIPSLKDHLYSIEEPDSYTYHIDDHVFDIYRIPNDTEVEFLDASFAPAEDSILHGNEFHAYYSEDKDLFCILYAGEEYAFIIHSDLPLGDIKTLLLELG